MKTLLLFISLCLFALPAAAQCPRCSYPPVGRRLELREQWVLRQSLFGGPYWARQVVVVPAGGR